MTCRDCNTDLTPTELAHGTEGPRGNGYGHIGLCCDCFDLSCGMSLELVNRERAEAGKRPLGVRVPR